MRGGFNQKWVPILIKNLILQYLFLCFRTFIPSEILPLVEKVAASIDELLPAPYAAEIRG